MKDQNAVSVNVGPGFLGLLAILFIGLKLTGYIAWSWWWVLAPIWIPLAFVLFVWVLILVAVVCGAKITMKGFKK
jgi:hypothetical protein